MKRLRHLLTSPAAAGVFVCGLLTACATPQWSGLDQQWPTELPAQAQVSGVPFIAQEDYECGPAALAMLMQTAGVATTAEALVPQVYLPGRKGSLQVEILAATRRHGLPGYLLKPELGAILREVAAGNPVLVFQNLSLPVYPVWHYAVVIGYDQKKGELLLHSGRTERLTISMNTFERTWARANHWSMVALHPARLPATAQPDGFAQSVAALEVVDPKAAKIAYTTALNRWPQHRALLLGVGNTAYAVGDLREAEKSYRAAVQVHADFADGWNNLAQVLWEQGDKVEASHAIAKAVALAGPRLSRYQELHKTISQENIAPPARQAR